MKFFKNNFKLIVGFIVGVILASGITVYAYSYYAKDISYTKPGTETAISVEQALNDLYTKTKREPSLVYSDLPTSYNDGSVIKTIDLEPGKYLLIVSMANSEGFNNTLNVQVTNASISNVLLNHHQLIGETNINMYHALLDVTGNDDIVITLTQSISRGYTLKNINIYKL